MDLANFNLHPPMASFPAPFIIVAMSLEVFGLISPREWVARSIATLLGMAAIFAGLAFFTGYYASEHANQTFNIPDRLIAQHQAAGRFLLFGLVPCFALHFISHRATHGVLLFRIIYLLLLAACVALVVYTGYLGGALVFEHGAGVKAQFS